MDCKSALVIIPPSDMLEQIQNIREIFDPAYERWMPHINIIWPFVPQSDFQNILPKVQELMKNIQPFPIVFKKIVSFPGNNGATYLDPQTPNQNIYQIYNQLKKLNIVTSGRKEYRPHLTVGKGNEIKECINELNWKEMKFMVRHVYLIARTESTPFEVYHAITLGEDIPKDITMTYHSNEVDEDVIISGSLNEVDEYMTDDISFDGYQVRVSKIGTKWIYKIRSGKRSIQKKNIQIILAVDNSGSMGHYTRQSINIIGKGMFALNRDTINMIPGWIALFSDFSDILKGQIRSPDDLEYITYPRQGRTNITSGLQCVVEGIEYQLINKAVPPDTHFVVVFLSDGQHNEGPHPESRLDSFRNILDKNNANVSWLVVGLSSQSKTDLGMKIKTQLETVPMDDLDNIYYANTTNEMNSILETLQSGATSSLQKGSISKLELTENGIFFDTNQKENHIYLSSHSEQIILINSNSEIPPPLLINGVPQELIQANVNPDDISGILDTIIPKLARERVANGPKSIQHKINELEQVIIDIEKIKESLKEKIDIPKSLEKIKPEQRRLLLKKYNSATSGLQQEKNRLRQLLASVSNNSSQQASFLQGINKKYASKAILKANTQNISLNELFQKLKGIKLSLRNALTFDLVQYAKIISSRPNYQEFIDKLVPDQVELFTQLKCLELNQLENNESKFDSLYTEMSDFLNLPKSLISLNTAWEEYYDWLETLNKSKVEFDDIYSLLVSFGLISYPIVMEHNNAVQMDPFQTSCQKIESCPIDTCSLLLSQKTKVPIASQTREFIQDALVLIDATCPNSSKIVYWSPINEYFSSITLCRDLYMYSGPQMQTSLHAHGYLKASELAVNCDAYLELAIKILYSIRRHWNNKCSEGKYVDLLKHWIIEWKGLTQSQENDCNHPVQLVLALGALDLIKLGIPFNNMQIPFINLFNEVLARTMKINLKGIANSKNTTSHDEAQRILCRMLNITEENSPKPTPEILMPEPDRDIIMDSCPRGHTINEEHCLDNRFIVNDIIQTKLRPYMYGVQLSYSVQEYLAENKMSWKKLMEHMEMMDDISHFKEYIRTNLKKVEGIDILDYLGVQLKERKQVSQTMYIQAMLCHDSQSRINITEESILDSETFYNLTTSLHMIFYDNANAKKRQEYLDCIGDVTYEQALQCNEYEYEQMCGLHTHMFSRQIFRALAVAAKRDPRKMEIFKKKSNHTVDNYINKLS